MKKTRIICTIGPASDSDAILEEMISSGMDAARLNFSHGSRTEHQARIDRIKRVRDKLGKYIPIILDTRGPEFRIGRFENKEIQLKTGDEFTFTSEETLGDETHVSVSYKNLPEELQIGDTILVNDGLVKFRVKSKTGNALLCETLIGGKLSDRKSMSFPGKTLHSTFLSDGDKADLLFGIKNDVDFAACSFVSSADDIMQIRKFLDSNGGEDIQLIAKIENQSGVDNAEEILECCDGLMVARGDLGVEVPYAKLPPIQKRLIRLCRKKGGLSITATEMLESMIKNPRPTRAEISDVANAVFDGTGAVMLSGESAAGLYPVEAVRAMAAVAEEAEKNMEYERLFNERFFELSGIADAVSHSACRLAIDTGAKCIVASTVSGATARMVSRFRAPTPIIGMTVSPKVCRRLALQWNVIPILSPRCGGFPEIAKEALEAAARSGLADPGDIVVITGGLKNRPGETALVCVGTLPNVSTPA